MLLFERESLQILPYSTAFVSRLIIYSDASLASFECSSEAIFWLRQLLTDLESIRSTRIVECLRKCESLIWSDLQSVSLNEIISSAASKCTDYDSRMRQGRLIIAIGAFSITNSPIQCATWSPIRTNENVSLWSSTAASCYRLPRQSNYVFEHTATNTSFLTQVADHFDGQKSANGGL